MMKTTLYGRDGTIRAVSSDRPLPMLISASSAYATAVLAPVAALRMGGEASASLTPEQSARYANPTAVALKQFCGSEGMDAAYCDGAIFGAAAPVSGQRAVICPPLNADGAMDVHRVSTRGRPAIAAATPSAGQSGIAFVRDVMIRTFPCGVETRAGRSAAAGSRPMRIGLDRGGEQVRLRRGERLVVELSDARGVPVARVSAGSNGDDAAAEAFIAMGLPASVFPGLGQATRVYTLAGAIYDADGAVAHRADPVTLRLASGSRWTANLRPVLSFPG